MKKGLGILIWIFLPLSASYGFQTVGTPYYFPELPVLNPSRATQPEGNQFSSVSQTISPVAPVVNIGEIDFQLHDMGEVWEEGKLLDLITVIPPDTRLQLGKLWESYGWGGNLFSWTGLTGNRWHQVVYSGIEVKNALSQNEVLRRLLEEGASLIETQTPYKVKGIEVIDISDTPGVKSWGILFKLGNSQWKDYWENWVMVLPHFEVGEGTYLQVVTIGTHSDEGKATQLAKEMTESIKNAFSGLISEVNARISDDWQDLLKELLFPDKEELNPEEIAFYEAVKEEWLKSGLLEEEIKIRMNKGLVLLPLIYKQVLYSPLAGAYLYSFDREDTGEELRYRRMLYKGIKDTIFEGNKLALRDLILSEPEKKDATYTPSEEEISIRYNVSEVEENYLSFPVPGLALKGMEKLSFEIKSSVSPGRRKTVEASTGFQIGFRYIDEQGKEQLVLKRFDELVGIGLTGDYQKVEIDLKSFGDIPWEEVTHIVFYFDKDKVGDKKSATLFLKDIAFSLEKETTTGALAKETVFAIDAKKYLEEKLDRPLILSILEDRILLRNFSDKVRYYLDEGYSLSQAYQKAKDEVKESNSPESLIPFIEELIFCEGRELSLGPEGGFDNGVWSFWRDRIAGDTISSLKRELAIKIFQLPSLQRWAVPTRMRGEYLYPDVPFLRQNLGMEEFLETVGMGYLKYFKDTRDEKSGLWFDNSMEIGAKDPVISLPAIAGGLVSIPLLVEYGIIDAKTGYEWANRALDTLLKIQELQENYMKEFLPYLEKKAREAGIDLEGLTLAQKMKRMEEIRIEAEVQFLETKGISFNRFLQNKGIKLEEITPPAIERCKVEFLRENSPMFKYGWGGFLYRYLTQEELPQRKVRGDLVNDLSVVDTSYVVYSALTVGEYFNTYQGNAEVLEKAKKFYANINWEAFLNPYGTMPNLFNMGWLPEASGNDEPGYFPTLYYEYATDEGLMIALLASMSPTYPVSTEVFEALHRERAGYNGGPEYILSPTGALFTYNLLDLWIDFSGMVYPYPEGEVNWDLNRRRAVITNWRFAQDMRNAGLSFGPYTWSIDTGYTPKGLRMDYGFGFKVVEKDPSMGEKQIRDITTTSYSVNSITADDFRNGLQEEINAMSGYPGSALNSLRALISFRKIMQSYYKMWGEYGVRDSFVLAEDVLRGGGFISNLWNSYDQMRSLNIFNLLGRINGKATPRDLFMSIDVVREGLERIGFRKIDTVKPVEISSEPTQFGRDFVQTISLPMINSLYDNNFQAVYELQKILETDSKKSTGDFELIKDTIMRWTKEENRDLAYLLLAMTNVAEAVNIAKAGCGDDYQSLIEGKNVDVTSAILEYLVRSGPLYEEALSYLRSIDESLIPPEMLQLARGLELVIHKNNFAKIDNIIDAFGWFKQVTEEGVAERIADILHKYDYDGELFGVYTKDELIGDSEAMMRVFAPLREEFQLEPLLPEEAGVLSYFAKQVDGYSLAQILEEVYIQSVLKPYAELVVGRPLDVTNPDGKDAGFLAGLAAEVKGGLKDGPNTLEEEIRKLKFVARMILLYDKARGAKHDLARDPRTQDQLDILAMINLLWQGYVTGKFNLLKPWQGIPKVQTKNQERPLLYLATSLDSSALQISGEVAYEGIPSLVIDEEIYRIPILLGNWSLINQLKFALRSEGDVTSVRLIIKNSSGEEASYRIDNIGSSWKDIKIPLWGPYRVPWMSDAENAEWEEWLTKEYWRRNEDGTYTLKADSNIIMECDRISDWSDIVEIKIEKTNPATDVYLAGIHYPEREERIIDMKEYLTTTAQSYFAGDKAIVVTTIDDKTFFVVDVKGNTVYYIQVNPPKSPEAAQGFWDFRRSLCRGEYKIQKMNLNDFIKLDFKDRVLVLDLL